MSKRYLFLDLLRAFALIEMIHGHSLDALLSSFQKSMGFWVFWQNIRGFTAPLFLFASGIAFAISTLKRNEYFYISKRLLNRLRRIIFIILLGYILHLPYFSLRKTIFESSSADIQNFLNVDILQCIGATILILQILYFISRKKETFIKLLVFTFINFYFFSLYVKFNEIAIPLFFLRYLKNSLFPLTPYSLYLFAGCIVGYSFMFKDKNRVFLYFSFIFLLVFFLLKITHLDLQITFFRISVICFLSFLLFKFEGKKIKIFKILQVIGKESLFVYFFHLPLIYGSAFNKGLKFYISGKLEFYEVYIVFLFLLSLFLILAFIWNYLKERQKERSQKIKYLLYISFLTAFIKRPY